MFVRTNNDCQLAPFCSVVSTFPMLNNTKVRVDSLGLTVKLGTSGNGGATVSGVCPQRFLTATGILEFPRIRVRRVLDSFTEVVPTTLSGIGASLPASFPRGIIATIRDGILELRKQLDQRCNDG